MLKAVIWTQHTDQVGNNRSAHCTPPSSTVPFPSLCNELLDFTHFHLFVSLSFSPVGLTLMLCLCLTMSRTLPPCLISRYFSLRPQLLLLNLSYCMCSGLISGLLAVNRKFLQFWWCMCNPVAAQYDAEKTMNTDCMSRWSQSRWSYYWRITSAPLITFKSSWKCNGIWGESRLTSLKGKLESQIYSTIRY